MISFFKRYSLFIVFISIFSSCDPGYGFIRKVVNNSSKEIVIIKTRNASTGIYLSDTTYIKSNSEAIIDNLGGLGNIDPTISCSFIHKSDSVRIVEKNSQKPLIKDFYNGSSWHSTFKKTTAMSLKTCISIITNNDLP